MLNIGRRPQVGLWPWPLYRNFVGQFYLLPGRMRRVWLFLENTRLRWGKRRYSLLITGLRALQREALQEIWNRTPPCSFLWSLTLLPKVTILLGLVCRLSFALLVAHMSRIFFAQLLQPWMWTQPYQHSSTSYVSSLLHSVDMNEVHF